MQKVNANSMEKALGAVLEDEHQIAATIARAHDETCDYTRDKVTPLLEAARARPIYAQCPPQMVSSIHNHLQSLLLSLPFPTAIPMIHSRFYIASQMFAHIFRLFYFFS